jgi:pimeloyl-ACP methyl ester carboxylesterase
MEGAIMRLVRNVVILFSVATATLVAQGLPPLPPEKSTLIFGQNIRYYEAGQGPTVILLHGLAGSAEVWALNFHPLASKFHVYAIDQIGFAHSDKPLLDYKIATWVDFLHEFMVTQKIAKASLVGNSLGGWIAAQFALDHPEMADKIVLVDAAGVRHDFTGIPDLNPSSLAAMRKAFEPLFYNQQMITDDLVRQAFTDHVRNNDGYTIQRTLAGILGQDQSLDSRLGTIHAPTLVLWGRQDALTPLSMGEQFQKLIPGAKLSVIEQCGHLPQVEKASEFNQRVMEFLGQ